MADSLNFTHLGQANFEGDYDALFRDKLIPEIQTQFEVKRVMHNYVRTKTISNAKSASFPVIGKTSADYVTVGDDLMELANTLPHNEITIYVDPYLSSQILIHDFEVKLQAYDDRAEISDEIADALAQTEDKQLLQLGCLAARSDGTIIDREGGSVLKCGTEITTNGDSLVEALTQASVELDNKSIPEQNRVAIMRPVQYRLLANTANVINADIGGGSFEFGFTGKVGGLTIVKSLNLPSTNIEAPTGTAPKNVYYGDFSNTSVLVMHKGAVGQVQVQGLTVEAMRIPWKLAVLLNARVLQGQGILRPECAVEIQASADTP